MSDHAVGRSLRAYAALRPRGSSVERALLTSGFVAGAALVAVSGAIHLHLWAAGYRTIPTIGPLFLAQGLVGAALALVVVVWRRVATAIFGAGFMAATIGGLVMSVRVGLFGFQDSLAAPWAGTSLVVEIAGAIVFGLVGLVLVRTAVHEEGTPHEGSILPVVPPGARPSPAVVRREVLVSDGLDRRRR